MMRLMYSKSDPIKCINQCFFSKRETGNRDECMQK